MKLPYTKDKWMFDRRWYLFSSYLSTFYVVFEKGLVISSRNLFGLSSFAASVVIFGRMTKPKTLVDLQYYLEEVHPITVLVIQNDLNCSVKMNEHTKPEPNPKCQDVKWMESIGRIFWRVIKKDTQSIWRKYHDNQVQKSGGQKRKEEWMKRRSHYLANLAILPQVIMSARTRCIFSSKQQQGAPRTTTTLLVASCKLYSALQYHTYHTTNTHVCCS